MEDREKYRTQKAQKLRRRRKNEDRKECLLNDPICQKHHLFIVFSAASAQLLRLLRPVLVLVFCSNQNKSRKEATLCGFPKRNAIKPSSLPFSSKAD
jgi:hypothetical protein